MDSEELFNWMSENEVSREQMAKKLGVTPESLSTYKSRGIPLKKQPLARKITNEWFIQSVDTDTTKLNIEFDEEQFDKIDRASRIVGETSIKDFIINSTIARAREEIAKQESQDKGKTA